MDILHAFPHCHSLSLNSLPCLRVNLNTQLLSSPHLPLYTHACQKMCHLIAITLQDATATNGNRIWIWFVLWHHVDGQLFSSNTLYAYNLILKTEYLYFYRITETITGDNILITWTSNVVKKLRVRKMSQILNIFFIQCISGPPQWANLRWAFFSCK